MPNDLTLTRKGHLCSGHFIAMGSTCEILLDQDNFAEAAQLVNASAQEAWRIEQKYSRYREGNIIHAINNAGGKAITVDDETAQLIDLAVTLYKMSDGHFDITSGVLRRAWKFDGSDRVPDEKTVADLLPLVGWHQARWEKPLLTLPAGMEIDVGGIGKEYAVDCVFNLLSHMTNAPMLVNFGGDMRMRGPLRDGGDWRVGIEKPSDGSTAKMLTFKNSGLATSGDARNFLMKDGVRYSHIINPKTGWPIQGGPRSVTIQASDCLRAGMFASLALLAGADAENFLRKQAGINSWLIW